MNGRNLFTTAELVTIRELLKRLRNVSKTQQKGIRDSLRKIGFYISDYNLPKCTVDDFDALIKSGLIKVVASEIASHITVPSKTIQQKNKSQTQVSNSDTIATINFKTIENLQQAGFTGFIPIAHLWRDCSAIPRIKGVYMVVRTTTVAPEFLEQGTGGYFQDKSPNVPLAILRANWVNDACVIYIGKAGGASSSTTLRSRLKQYLQFGQGKAVGHRGGRYIWQLKDAADLLFCWMPLFSDDPTDVETNLIRTFKGRYNGMRPFANLKK